MKKKILWGIGMAMCVGAMSFSAYGAQMPTAGESLQAAAKAYDNLYVLPASSSRYLEPTEVCWLSPAQLRIARNEIYARHGRMFVDQNLQNYFNAQCWYTPRIPANQFNEAVLNKYEVANIALIQSYE